VLHLQLFDIVNLARADFSKISIDDTSGFGTWRKDFSKDSAMLILYGEFAAS